MSTYKAPKEEKVNPEAEAKIVKSVNEQFMFSKRYLDPVHQRMNQQEELYRSFIDANNYPHNARVFDPRIFRVIETVTPRMVANEPIGDFYPTEKGDVATTHILKALIKYDWRRAEMFPKLVEFVKSMLIFGTAFGRVFYDWREQERTQMVPKVINGKNVWTPKSSEKIKVTTFDGPNFETLNMYDCFPDPNASNIHNMRWFIYRTFKTYDELEDEDEAYYAANGYHCYKNLDKLKEAMDLKDNKDTDSDGPTTTNSSKQYMQYREHRRTMLSTQELHGEDPSNPELVILTRYDRNNWVQVVSEYEICIQEKENPYFHGELPIVYGVDYMYPGELYGMGEIEPVDRIQRAINAVLNQRLDNVNLTLNTMWKVQKGQQVDMHTLISAPGNIITTGNMNAVEAITTPDVTGGTFVQTMNYLTSAMQNGSGITDYTAGINSSANTASDTATGTRLIQQEANAQFKLKLQLFNHMVIERIANQWKDLRIQYTTEAQKIRILGKEDVQYLLDNTNLATTTMDGQSIAPGEDVQGKLEMGTGNSFAFLNLLPEDIQPSIAGNYDFITVVSSDQLNDPITLQQNFFSGLDRLSTPAWTEGLASQNKQLDYVKATNKVFENLHLGIDADEMVIEKKAPPMQQDPNTAAPNAPIDGNSFPPTGIPNLAGNFQPPQPEAQPIANG